MALATYKRGSKDVCIVSSLILQNYTVPPRLIYQVPNNVNLSDSMTGGAGGVARFHQAFLGAWSKPLPGVSDPFVAELLALRDWVIFAQLRGYSHVIMEVDCLELVNYGIHAASLVR